MTKSAVVGVHEAKTQFSRLLARVEAGEEIEIARRGDVVARLIPANRRRRLGTHADDVVIHDDFDAPLPPDIAEAFGM